MCPAHIHVISRSLHTGWLLLNPWKWCVCVLTCVTSNELQLGSRKKKARGENVKPFLCCVWKLHGWILGKKKKKLQEVERRSCVIGRSRSVLPPARRHQPKQVAAPQWFYSCEFAHQKPTMSYIESAKGVQCQYIRYRHVWWKRNPRDFSPAWQRPPSNISKPRRHLTPISLTWHCQIFISSGH